MHVVIKNLSQTMKVSVACREQWSHNYREIGRQAMGDFLRDRMKE
jgi:hypothetical protein